MATKIVAINNFYRGDTRYYTITMTNQATGEPISVDGGKLTITFKVNKADLDEDAALQVVTLGVEPDPIIPLGIINAVLTDTDTDIEPGNYYYDFQFVSASGSVTTLLPQEIHEDRIKILEDITRTTT